MLAGLLCLLCLLRLLRLLCLLRLLRLLSLLRLRCLMRLFANLLAVIACLRALLADIWVKSESKRMELNR